MEKKFFYCIVALLTMLGIVFIFECPKTTKENLFEEGKRVIVSFLTRDFTFLQGNPYLRGSQEKSLTLQITSDYSGTHPYSNPKMNFGFVEYTSYTNDTMKKDHHSIDFLIGSIEKLPINTEVIRISSLKQQLNITITSDKKLRRQYRVYQSVTDFVKHLIVPVDLEGFNEINGFNLTDISINDGFNVVISTRDVSIYLYYSQFSLKL